MFLAAPLAAEAQQATKIARIGYLATTLDARSIVENVSGLFRILLEWDKARHRGPESPVKFAGPEPRRRHKADKRSR